MAYVTLIGEKTTFTADIYPRTQQIEFTVEIDWDMLNVLARKASKNKSKKSGIGPLRVRVLRMQPGVKI